MELFIPTLSRPNRQETWKNLPSALKERTKLIIDEKETRAYREFPHATLSEEYRGIGKVRQWVIDNAKGPVVMLDDDLRFAVRRTDEPTKFRPATSQEVAKVFEYLEQCLSSYAHASVATREGGNRDPSDYLYNTRLLRVLAYRADVLRMENISFDRLPVMEDFDVTLQLLRKGYANVVLNWAVQDQLGSNLSGGCSTYRSLEIQKEAAYKLRDLHSDFVTVVTKQTKTAWQGQERTDVRIQWKKAFESAGISRVLDSGTGANP